MSHPLSEIEHLLHAKQFEKVIKLSRRFLKDLSLGPQAHRMSGFAYFESSRPREAITILTKGIKKWPRNDAIRQDLARFLYLDGRQAEALKQYLKLAETHPNDSMTLSNVASCYLALNDLENALVFAKRSVELPHPDKNGYNTLAIVYTRQKKIKEAEQTYLKLLDVFTPDIRQIHNFLMFCETHNKTQSAKEYYRTLPENIKNHPLLQSKMAWFERADKNFDTAQNYLENALQNPDMFSPVQYRACQFELGKTLDLQADYNQAFTLFDTVNTSSLNAFGTTKTESPYEDFKTQEKIEFHGENISSQPVFILGFPRSGTTLLEQILNTALSIHSFEESPVLLDTFRKARSNNHSSTPLKRAEYQQAFYQQYIEDFKYNKNQLLCDRSAPNALYFKFIRKLFPTAKIIFLHRHPYDLVLSCFMQDFLLNFQTKEFTKLDTTAQLLRETYHQLPENDEYTLEIRYEDIVDDFENKTKEIFRFLELEWSPEVHSFWQRARQKDRIYTASYTQVTQPLYQSAVGRWKNYRSQLESIMPDLLSLCQRLKYSVD